MVIDLRMVVVMSPEAPPLGWSPSASATAPTAVKQRQELRQPYPHFKVVVLDDDVNTFQHVVECLVRYIPGVGPDQAWALAHRIDGEGSAVVWCGPQEQAELYHQQLAAEGLSMAPLERA
jgi:ATP-dependent Clp protease adaptor protein ClpS